MKTDILHRYLFEDADVRGELVQLEHSHRLILTAQDYPPQIQQLLGELTAATALLTATLKFEGDISLQLQGDGPVSLAVINGNHSQQLRGVARFDASGLAPEGNKLTDLLGKGQMVITLSPKVGQRYQGLVPIESDTLAQCLESYFSQSEQLATSIKLFASARHSGGILLQALPQAKQSVDEQTQHFDHLKQLTQTLSANEVFNLAAREILHRLYHEENIRLFDPMEISFFCGCSRERSAAVILSLPKEEIQSILADQGQVSLDCEYCHSQYQFTPEEIESLDAAPSPAVIH